MAVVIGKSRGLLASMPAALFGKFSLNGGAKAPAKAPAVKAEKVKPGKRAASRKKKK
jgi:hypothetical protein